MGTAMTSPPSSSGCCGWPGATRLFGGVLAVAVTIGFILIKTSPNRMSRLACIGAPPNPARTTPAGMHGIYAPASGGLFGSGLGASVEKWGDSTKAHTDFIFAITGRNSAWRDVVGARPLRGSRLCGYPRGRTHGGPLRAGMPREA